MAVCLPGARRRWACVLVALTALLLLHQLACNRGVGELRRWLDEDDVTRALAVAKRASAAERPSVVAAVMRWAEDHRDDSSHVDDLVRVYLSVIRLDPTASAAYMDLGILAAEFSELSGIAAEGLALWTTTRQQKPALQEEPEFVRAGSVLARAADPQGPDRLCRMAASGQLAPAEHRVVLDAPLPAGLGSVQLVHCHGGWIALEGTDRAGRAVGYVVSAVDGAPRWRVDDCLALSLSPSGHLLAYGRPRASGDVVDVEVLDMRTGEAHPMIAVRDDQQGAVPFRTAWSPDEKHLAIACSEGLIVVHVDERRSQFLDQPEGVGQSWQVLAYPQWIAEGALLAAQLAGPSFGGPSYEGLTPVRLLDLTSGSERAIPVMPLCWSLGESVWSPDGHFLACHIGPEHSRWIQVMRPDLGVSGDILITLGDVTSRVCAWSPDSNRLLFSMGLLDLLPYGSRLWVWDRCQDTLSLFCSHHVDSATWGSDNVVYWVPSSASGEYRLMGARLPPE